MEKKGNKTEAKDSILYAIIDNYHEALKNLAQGADANKPEDPTFICFDETQQTDYDRSCGK